MAVYKFEDIAFNSTAKKKPVDEDKYTYVGLEHLDPDSIYVTRFGADVAPKGEKLLMKKGDVLFGKRRAYQKKVAIAPFDGIFSAHGMVLRPKEDVIDKDFFPLFIKSDYFLDEAIKISVGSLSPTINWRDLKELKFSLPSLEEQKKLARVLWSIYDTKEEYKKLIKATDDLVKSQFIEMFSDTEKGALSDVSIITMGQSPDGKTYNNVGEGMPFYQGKTEFGDLYIGEATTWTTEPSRIAEANDVLMSVRAPVGSTNVANGECCIGRGLASIRPIQDKTTTMFILYAMRSIEDDIANMGVGSTFKAINKEQVYKLPIPIADIELQNRFVEIAEQSDKSKFYG
ncbi:MAG: restriction endonuclease subunit S [Acetivibrio ethanolgignens]